jgi:hypothetical protein
MSRKVHKLNRDHVKLEAEKAKRSGGDFEFYEWIMGDNDLRLGPPYNSKGLLFLPVITHFELPPDKQVYRCLSTWNLESCSFCRVIEELFEEIPDIDLGRQLGSLNHYGNIIDRNGDSVWQPCRFTPKIYNWVMTQIDNPKIGDITDPDDGFDLTIKKAKKRGKKGGTFIEYTPGLIPNKIPLDDDGDYIDTLLENLPNLENVFPEPPDEELKEMEGAAKRMKAYYLKKYDVGNYSSSSSGSRERRYQSSSQNKVEEEKNESKRRYGSKSSEKSNKTTKKENTRVSENDDCPSCLASIEKPCKNNIGLFGYSEECEDCLLCPHDMECEDAIKARPELNK